MPDGTWLGVYTRQGVGVYHIKYSDTRVIEKARLPIYWVLLIRRDVAADGRGNFGRLQLQMYDG
eukprot:gene8126-9656_t